MEIFVHNKSFIVKLSILIAFIAILTSILWYCNTGAIELYAVFPHVKGLKKNDPVLIENVPVGLVKSIHFDKKSASNLIVIMEVSNDFNIPEKSTAEIIVIDQATNNMGINISLIASLQYLDHGDTILTFTNTNLIDSLINISKNVSQVIKDSLMVKEKSYNYSSNGPVFKVQIFLSKSLLPDNSMTFRGLSNVNFYFENDHYKYVVGNFTNINEAKTFCDNMKNKGFKDAFVVAFMKGKRISIKEANDLLKK